MKLQGLADELGITLKVSHFPSGTSKWNKIEHRLFSFISKNWRGKPLLSLAVIVDLISATTTETGLAIKCVVDQNEYKKGIEVSNEELEKVNLFRANSANVAHSLGVFSALALSHPVSAVRLRFLPST